MSAAENNALLALSTLTIITFVVFGKLLARIRHQGGKVRERIFDLPEFLVCIVLVGFFSALIAKTLLRAGAEVGPKITIQQVLPNALFFVVLAVGLSGFLKFRGIQLTTAFGLDRLTLPRAVSLGLGLILASAPLVFAGSIVMQLFLRQQAQEQELVTLFKEVSRASNRSGVAEIFLAGAVIAPICEEFLRGLFYATFKRYLGPVASALLTAGLFAAFHLNLTSLPSLFILALCFTIAYEAFGSLLIPMTMHALFNVTQLAILYLLT